MSDVLKPEICVIGAGAAGLTIAAAAAAFGVSVVLIERSRMGGDCLNYGCVPSKALIAAARQAHAMSRAAAFGVSAEGARVDFQKVREHVRATIAAIAPNDSVERFTGMGVRVIQEHARFIDRRTVQAGRHYIRARRFVVATGSAPLVPPIDGLEAVPYLTNETIFDLDRLPAHLAIVGGGPVGMEMAQAFARLGSAVTLIEAERVLGRDDPELVARVVDAVRADGVTLREGVKVLRAARRGRYGVRVDIDGPAGEERIEATHLLIAAGRRPILDDLGLEAARIAFDADGIRVDRRLRTSNRRVHAIGDVTAGPRFTHWGAYQAGLVVRSVLFRFGGKVNPDLVTWTIFTDPELAHVGLSEEEARRRHGRVAILRWPFSENDRAHTERATAGVVKAVTDRRGRILGAGIVGAHAGELIAPWALAISQGLTVKAMLDSVLPYPTLSETARRVALAFYAPKLQSPALKRLVRLMRLLP